MSGRLVFYDGSYLLQGVSDILEVPIDQLNFLVCQLTAILLGFPFRNLFSPDKTSPVTRHAIEVIIGISMAYFCFGNGIGHLILQSVICYTLMLTLKPGLMEKVVFVASIGYLCLCHIYRQYYDYGGYTLDITGPLMVNTQRLSSLAFCLRDGAVDETKLTPHMKRYAVRKFPSLLEYCSYVFCFHNLMCGPHCFYKDFIAFIEGSDVRTDSIQSNGVQSNGVVRTPDTQSTNLPSPLLPMLKLLLTCGMSVFIVIQWLPQWPASYLEEPEFLQEGFFYKMYYIAFVTSLARFKYYFAWKLGQVANMSCGLGFSGYSSTGTAKWDNLEIADILQCELCLSLKVLLDRWNITTAAWLRHVVYERIGSSMAVFVVSAFWHGFYPGYYITFVTGGLFSQAARLIRRNVRVRFQTSKAMSRLYDAITFTTTRVAVAYMTFPFVILNFHSSMAIYWSLGYWMHILCIAAIITFTFIVKPKRSEQRLKAS